MSQKSFRCVFLAELSRYRRNKKNILVHWLFFLLPMLVLLGCHQLVCSHGHQGQLPRFGVRHVQMVFLFMLMTIGIGMRVQLSVVIVAMTDPTASPNPDVPVYDWSNKSVVLSSFFWGYIGLQLFAAHWGRKYGSKPFLIVTMTINATAITLIPILASKFGSYGVMGARVVQGLCQGFVMPSTSNLLGRWTHISERSRLGSLVAGGVAFGNIISLIVNGFISASWLGWPYCFYLYALLGYLWVIAFFFYGASSPAQCRYISKAEKDYIESSTNVQGKKEIPTPWKDILTSKPFWGLYFAQVGQMWGFNTLLTEIPNYMNKVMKFDMQSNGLLSASPYMCNFVLAFFLGFTADYIINHKYLSRTATRKIFNGISGIGAGTFLLAQSFLPADARVATVLILISAVGTQSAAVGGYSLNHVDLSPRFAGTLQAMCNSCGSGLSILAPLAVHLIVTDETNKLQWRIIFIIASVMYIVPSIIYTFLASGKRQKWDGAEELDEAEVKAKKISVWSIQSM